MTYEQFKNKYNGKYIDFDGYYGAQCWDLAQFYMKEVLNLPTSILSGCGNVKNMLVEPKISLLKKYFDEISVYEMYPGDLCIWSSNHIAIFDHWDGNQNWYFSQNPNKCQVMTIDMPGLHAFRKKSNVSKEKVDQVLHAGSKVQIPGTFDVISVRKSDNTAVVRINGVDYRLSSTPLKEVE
jgi:hypothetical protein